MNQAWMQKHRKQLLIGVPIGFILLILLYAAITAPYESTDDAYVQAARAAINSNVAGQVITIYVKDNQPVKKGDALFSLDDRRYKIAVDNAKAQLVNAQLEVMVLRATYLQALAKKLEALQNFKFAEKEFKRQTKLAASKISSDIQLNKATNDYEMAKQEVEAATQGWIASLANLNNNPDIDLKDHPLVKQAQANLDLANLNLEYTVIIAPFNGIVTKVEQLQPGDFINAGEPVFALISTVNRWVEANFKETQITYMRPGQSVKIEVDAFPNYDFKGKIVSLSPGTGSTFSILPPENATGNWVKVVQRVPVRISLDNADERLMLGSGLSTTVTVNTEHGIFSSEKKL
jgi:membrane fusion protein (multidrug efflux system)